MILLGIEAKKGFKLHIWSTHGKRNVDAAKEVVLAARSRRLCDLLEKPPQPLHPLHFVEFADDIKHTRLVVVVPKIDDINRVLNIYIYYLERY